MPSWNEQGQFFHHYITAVTLLRSTYNSGMFWQVHENKNPLMFLSPNIGLSNLLDTSASHMSIFLVMKSSRQVWGSLSGGYRDYCVLRSHEVWQMCSHFRRLCCFNHSHYLLKVIKVALNVEGGGRFLKNTSKLLTNHTASSPIRQKFSFKLSSLFVAALYLVSAASRI